MLELRDLHLVRALAEEGTQTLAARRLHTTQSAVSQRLRDLEGRLGGPLFDRSGRRLRALAAGERVLEAARSILPVAERAAAEAQALASGRAGVVRFATSCYLSYDWFPPLLGAYAAAWPGVEVRVEPEASEHAARWVAERRLDVALTCPDVDGPSLTGGLDAEPLFEDDVVGLVPPSHPWAGCERVAVDALVNEHVLAHPSALDPAKPLGRALAARGLAPARFTPLPTSAGFGAGMARAGMGVAVMARWAARADVERGGVVAVGLGTPPLTLAWSIATRAERRAPLVDAFVEHLRQYHPLAERSSP